MDLSKYFGLSEAAARLPGHPHASAVWRMCRLGNRTADGQRIRLQHVKVGGRIFTTEAWIEAYIQQLTAADMAVYGLRDGQNKPTKKPKKRSATSRDRSHKRAMADLAAAGVAVAV